MVRLVIWDAIAPIMTSSLHIYFTDQSMVCFDQLILLSQQHTSNIKHERHEAQITGNTAICSAVHFGEHHRPLFVMGIQQSGISQKVVALFSATNFSSFVIELLQLHDAIQIKWNYAWIHYVKANDTKKWVKFHFGTKFSSIFL